MCVEKAVNSWAAIYLTFNQVNCVNRRRVYESPTGCWRSCYAAHNGGDETELLFLPVSTGEGCFRLPRRAADDKTGIFQLVNEPHSYVESYECPRFCHSFCVLEAPNMPRRSGPGGILRGDLEMRRYRFNNSLLMCHRFEKTRNFWFDDIQIFFAEV